MLGFFYVQEEYGTDLEDWKKTLSGLRYNLPSGFPPGWKYFIRVMDR
jgi:hypothetical protein